MSLKFYSPKAKRQYPESRLQATICQHLLMNGVFSFSIPNERQASPQTVARLKATGMLPGIADLCILIEGRAHFLEVKSPDGIMSAAQRDFQANCIIENIPYKVVNNIDAALKILTEWGAFPRVRSQAA